MISLSIELHLHCFRYSPLREPTKECETHVTSCLPSVNFWNLVTNFNHFLILASDRSVKFENAMFYFHLITQPLSLEADSNSHQEHAWMSRRKRLSVTLFEENAPKVCLFKCSPQMHLHTEPCSGEGLH